MSARTLSKSATLQPLPVESGSKVLPLPAGFFHIRKNGIEFQSSTPILEWTEMTVELETSATGKKVRCTGVVVSCNGNRHSGYQVAMLFTDLSKQSQARLNDLAFASLG
ncbi:MAG: hypothetical protein HZA90_01230 [Verrucomicrobia bacterium]|nr:hypothetical protein [Verrucomicrobiota bacterium]